MRDRGETEPLRGMGSRDRGSQHQGPPLHFWISDSSGFQTWSQGLGGMSPSTPTLACPAGLASAGRTSSLDPTAQPPTCACTLVGRQQGGAP